MEIPLITFHYAIKEKILFPFLQILSLYCCTSACEWEAVLSLIHIWCLHSGALMLHCSRINEMEGQETTKAEALCQQLAWGLSLKPCPHRCWSLLHLLTVSITVLLLTLQGRQQNSLQWLRSLGARTTITHIWNPHQPNTYNENVTDVNGGYNFSINNIYHKYIKSF